MDATEKDFEVFFSVAKAHGLSLYDCQRIAVVELGKSLGSFSKEELELFAMRICPDCSDVPRIHSKGNA